MAALTINSTVNLPGTGYPIPLLGFGVYQNYTAKPSCLEAFKAGYKHVDSAQMYRNEADVGAALRESGLKREDVFITSKVASKTHGYDITLQGIDESLKKFGFAKKAGKIRTVGVSNYNIHHLEEIKNAGLEAPAVNQIELHPKCQQKPIVDYCRANNILIEAYCPILRGELDDPIIQELANKHNRDPAQILIRWSLQKGFIPLPKSATPARIHSNAKVYDFQLSEEDIQKLDSLDKGKEGAISWNPVNAS
ncbi:NADP-dependent oxidoreductase domain-containing protein [Cyathus striatus]|nr:NADP-dependent oxidoreductase domain-containing protein [Cyathus striatus]